MESVDWDLGTCLSCGSYLLAQWSEYAPTRTFYDKLSPAEGERLRRSEGRERLSLLKQWYADH